MKVVKGQPKATDKITRNEAASLDTIDIIVNNSSYTYTELKKMYVVEFYMIHKKILKKLRAEASRKK